MLFTKRQNKDTNTITCNLEFDLPHALEEQTISDCISKARDQIIKEVVDVYVNEHFQEVVKSIDIETIRNLVILQAAKEFGSKIYSRQ